jgi:hypothetical protein
MLVGEEARLVEQAIARDPSLAAELVGWRETAAQLALTLPALPVTRGLWSSIERAIGRPRSVCGIRGARVGGARGRRRCGRRLLDDIDLASSWVAGPSPSSRLYHIQPGPAILAVDGIAGFVKVEPGATFPRHKHIGPEHVLVLQGGFTDETAATTWPATTANLGAGTAHDFVATWASR